MQSYRQFSGKVEKNSRLLELCERINRFYADHRICEFSKKVGRDSAKALNIVYVEYEIPSLCRCRTRLVLAGDLSYDDLYGFGEKSGRGSRYQWNR